MGNVDSAIDRPLGALGFLMERKRGDGMALGIVVAAVVHAAVFAATWPSFTRPATEVVRELILVPSVRFIDLPKPTSREQLRAPVRQVPIPDPTPFDPEPIRSHEPALSEVLASPDIVTGPVAIPDPPPDIVETDPIRVGGKVSPPRVIHRVLPRYTEAARQVKIQGAVILDAVIDKEGRVQEITVLGGQPFGLTENAVEAVRQWRFEPSVLNGRVVAVRYVLTIRFRLE